ncbi:MAG: hypothetical protein ABI765_04045 [Gemmatimonadota bacterium]
MADQKNSPDQDKQKDLADKKISKEDSEQVKGGRAWDIPAGTASPGNNK